MIEGALSMAKALDDSIYCSAFSSVVSLDFLRDRPHEDGRPFDVPDPQPLADDRIDEWRRYEIIHSAVNRLSPRQRAVVQAIFFAESTVMRSAWQLEISGAAVVKLRTKALRNLADALAPQRPSLFA
jgi:DNA-directed RNA polymerase specialized sigma subunit